MTANVIGVRFREAAKIYHFAPPQEEVYVGEYVVVPTAHGEELARIVTTPDADAGPVPSDVRPIKRLASNDDRVRAIEMQDRAGAMLRRMRVMIAELELPLYVSAVQINLGGTEATGFFEADEHVDFRGLQEAIEVEYQLSLHMKRIGPRDRAKLIDGYDICGQRLCCASWMTDFPKVGIRMAKAQDLSLNPDKISGVCGRLLCCLTFEFDVYKEMRGTLPKVGAHVSTPVGQGRVVAVSVPKQTATVELEQERRRVEVPAAEMGTAVRVETAPNQAIVEASERTQVTTAPPRRRDETDRQGDRPVRGRRRRRRRGTSSEQAAPRDQSPRKHRAGRGDGQAGQTSANRSEAGADRRTAPRRRRRGAPSRNDGSSES